jgi:hypothetical protein
LPRMNANKPEWKQEDLLVIRATYMSTSGISQSTKKPLPDDHGSVSPICAAGISNGIAR